MTVRDLADQENAEAELRQAAETALGQAVIGLRQALLQCRHPLLGTQIGPMKRLESGACVLCVLLGPGAKRADLEMTFASRSKSITLAIRVGEKTQFTSRAFGGTDITADIREAALEALADYLGE